MSIVLTQKILETTKKYVILPKCICYAEEGEGLRIGELLRLPVFLLMILLMICVGASEATMTQWASAFTESALGVSLGIILLIKKFGKEAV